MIWAAAYCEVKQDVKPPRELIWYWRSEKFGPPFTGGWMEQPAGLVPRMSYLNSVYEAMRLYRRCDKQLKVVKERYGKGAWLNIVKILKEIRGYND